MNSRELMTAVLEGRRVETIPVAPYFWGADYSWKLTGRPVWEAFLGPCEVGLEMIDAVDARHGCDWVRELHYGTGWLNGKQKTGENSSCVFFVDESTGDEWIFHKEGHWLGHPGEDKPEMAGCVNREIPKSKSEVDALFGPVPPPDISPIVPNRALRDRFPTRFLCGSIFPPFAGFAYQVGFENALLLLSEDPSLCAYIMEHMIGDVERHAKQLAANGFDAGLMCDSWASADIMSPKTYCDWVAPFHKKISDALHAAGLKSIIYNTGNILPMLDTMVDMGYDAITVEERIKGIELDITGIRETVGPDVCLFGNFDSYLLLEGDRDKIRSEVDRQIKGGAGGPFIMGTGSPICDATEPEVVDYWIELVRGNKGAGGRGSGARE